MSEVANKLAFQTQVQNFLDKFCIPDKKSIPDRVHKHMMLTHFYYVDIYEQGYYILDDHTDFHRELSGEEYYIYSTLWTNCVAEE